MPAPVADVTGLSGIANYALFSAPALIGPIVALILVLARAHGRVRVVGVIGSLLLIISTLGGGLLSLFAPLIRERLDLPASTTSLLFIPTNIIGWAGAIVLGLAVVVRLTGHSPAQPYQPSTTPGVQ